MFEQGAEKRGKCNNTAEWKPTQSVSRRIALHFEQFSQSQNVKFFFLIFQTG